MQKNCVVILLCLFGFHIPSFSQQKDVTLRLKWWHQFQFAGYYAANIKGFYNAEGLKVKIITGDAVHPITEEVLHDRADFGITGSDLLIEFAQGKPLVALGAVFQHSPYVIMSLEKTGIKTASDLAGKTIMASENQGWVELKAVLLKEGIDLKSLNVINHSWNNADLVKGKVDAMTGYKSVELYQLEKMGAKPSYIVPLNYGIDFYGDVLFTTKKLVTRDPETVEKFRKASFKGWEYAMSHKEELCDYILTLPGVRMRGATKESLLQEANKMEELILPQLIEPGHMNPGRWQYILKIHQDLGLIKPGTNIDAFLYKKKTTVLELLRSLSIYITGGILLLFLIIILYGIFVRKAVRKRTRELEKEMKVRVSAETALKKNEELLRNNEALLNTMINSMNEGVALSTPDGELLIYNKALEKMLGPKVYSAEKDWGRIYGISYVESRTIVPKEKLPLYRALLGETSFDEEYVVIQKGRPDVYIVCSGIPIRNEEGEIIAGMTVKYDITQERAAREEKKGTEEKYKTLVEHASDAIVIGDKQTNFIEANAAALKLFGYSKEEFLQLSLPELLVINENDPPLRLNELLAGGIVSMERIARRKDGSTIIIDIYSKMLPDGNILGFARDITEKKKAEEQIRQHEQQLDLIYNKVADIIFMLDVKGKDNYIFSSVNQSFLKTTGLQINDVLNKNVRDVIPEPSLSFVLNNYKEAITSKKTIQWEEETPYPTGRKTGIVSITPVFNNNGDCVQLIGSVHDITETKYVQDELRKMNERYEHVTNATFDAIWDWDLKTNNIFWGPNFEKLFGHKTKSHNDIVTDSFDNIHPDDKKMVLAGLNEVIKSKERNWSAEYRYRKADNSYAYVQDKAVVLRNDSGEAYRIIGAMRDISKQKSEELHLKMLEEDKERRAQERELLINELTKNNKELKQFSFITSHNLRAPLTNLIAIADLIDSDKIEDKGTRELIEGFKTSTVKLNETLNDLIKILVIKESSNQTLDKVCFSEVYKQIASSIESIINNSKAKITTDFSACDSILYNRLYMESIFLNMITNSIKYAHPNRIPEINIRTEKNNEEVRLIFKDNGIGFNMDTARERMFGLYQKFHDHPDSKGIGLYLVHSQVTSLGGVIETESKVGEGATFIIKFKP